MLFHGKKLILHEILRINMNKKVLSVVIAVFVLLLAGIGYLGYNLMQEKQANQDMQELAALDKQEMEKEYQDFAAQYSEMKTFIKNDSIIAELTAEQERTQKLLEELKRTHASDAAEITRLKKELATVRAVLRSYVIQIDSLNRLNQNLMDEYDRVRTDAVRQERKGRKEDSQGQDARRRVHHHQECDGIQRYAQRLCAHHNPRGRTAQWWRHL